MSYVGNKPALNYVNLAVQHFSTSATASYTLNQSVSDEVDIALFINNVRQQPGSSYAYTASGTTLTLSQATAGSDTMYCIFLGKAVETVNPPAGSVNTSELVDNAVTTAKITSDSVTYDKIQDLGTANRVLGGASTGTVGEVQVVDGMTNFVSTSSVAGLQIKGDGTTDGTLQLNCSQNTHGIKIKSPPHSAGASYTLTMPTTDGNSSQFLQTNGSGVLTWAEAGGGGKIGQVISTTKTDTFSESVSNGVVGSTITGLTVTITPSATTSKILVILDMNAGLSSIGGIHFHLYRGTTHIDLGDASGSRSRSSKGMIETDSTGYKSMLSTNFLDTPSSTSALTYSVKMGHTSGSSKTMYLNRDADYPDQFRYPINTSTITVMEVLA